jgi:uncharacterized protein YkwD
MKRLIVLVAGLVVATGVVLAPARATTQTDSVETKLLALINQGRAGQAERAEVMHAGLRHVAQEHSGDMSARNHMDHNGYPGRISAASPDPAESNGPPDDGFNGASCENVAWWQPGRSVTTDQVAQEFYNLWYNSPEHYDCMFDTYRYNLNVAGVGIYYANGIWWATFDSAFDRTPPNGTSSSSAPPPSSSPSSPSSPAVAGTWTRVEDTNVSYSGSWVPIMKSAASGGRYTRSNTTNASALLAFTGTGVRWIGVVSSTAGIANVYLDGRKVASVDQYADSTAYQRTLFTRTGLAPGRHTIQLVVSGLRNPNAGDQRVYVDAFDYFS